MNRKHLVLLCLVALTLVGLGLAAKVVIRILWAVAVGFGIYWVARQVTRKGR
jgi:predicted PurR-regulated permease PerM